MWTEEAKLTPSDGVETGTDAFGHAVAISASEELALVGAYLHDGAGVDAGAAYLFERTASGWMEWGKLLPSEVDDGDWYGRAVALDGESAIVGAQRDPMPGVDIGSAYIFSLTPADKIEFLKSAVDELVASGSLTPVQGNVWLKSRLNLAQAFIEAGNPIPAIPALNIFIGIVQSMINNGTLTPEEGQPLIDGAQAILENIGG